ncbi:MAG: hypothetical protein HW416_3480 [Chloroflexi bacterium]|nr:hypothetical protein [Chloroflexota bacterium]
MNPIDPIPRSQQRIVTFGGGTGHYYLLRGLAEHNAPDKITAIPGSWDDGGSSGRLRTELGVLPPGDARQCLLALMQNADQREVAQRLFDDRLVDIDGPFRGHSLGNLLSARLDQIFRGQDRGIEAARRLFQIPSKIAPASLTDLRLIARTHSGIEIEGETNVDLRRKRADFLPDDRITRIYFNTRADPNPEALRAVAEAGKIVFSSGDLYTSILPHLLVDGMPEAISAAAGPLVFVLNLMTKRGETDGYTASDHLRAFLFYLGDNSRLDYVVANSEALDPEILDIYRQDGQEPVELDEDACQALAPRAVFVRVPLGRYLKKEHLLRHDPEKLALTVLGLPSGRTQASPPAI